MKIEVYANYGDALAIVGFGMLVYYFYKKPKRTLYETMLYLFAIAGFIVDTYLTLYRSFWKRPEQAFDFRKIIETLYRQAARWAVASEQDANEIIRLLHANYATGYLWALKDIVTTEEFKKIIGSDFLQFEQKITAIQDEATNQVVRKCTSVIPVSDKELLKAIYHRAE